MGALDGRHQGGGRLAHPEGREARGQVGGPPVGAQAVDLGLVLGQEEEAARAVLDGLAEGLLAMLPAAEDDPAGDVEATVVLTQPVGKPVHAPRGAAAAGVAAPDVGVIPAEGEVAERLARRTGHLHGGRRRHPGVRDGELLVVRVAHEGEEAVLAVALGDVLARRGVARGARLAAGERGGGERLDVRQGLLDVERPGDRREVPGGGPLPRDGRLQIGGGRPGRGLRGRIARCAGRIAAEGAERGGAYGPTDRAPVRRPPGVHGLHAEVHQACLGHQEEGQEAEEGAAAQAVEAPAVHQGAYSSICSAGRQEGKARSAPGAAGQAAMASASVSATTRVPSGRGPSRSVSAM